MSVEEAHQYKIRVAKSKETGRTLYGDVSEQINLDLKNAEVKRADLAITKKIILEYEWLGTMSSTSNHYGIYLTKHAKNMAVKYGFNLYDKNQFIHSKKYILLSDVQFMIEHLWLEHFLYDFDKPIDVSYDEYNYIFYNLQQKFPTLIDFSFV